MPCARCPFRSGIPGPSFSRVFLPAIANPKAYVAIAAVFAGTSLAGASFARLLIDPRCRGR